MAFAEINIPSHYTNSIHSNIINKWVTEFRILTNSKEKPILKWARLNECYQNDIHCKEIFKMCVAFQSLAEGWLSVAHSSTWKFWAKLLSHIFFDIFLSFLAPPPSRFLSHSQCIYWHLNIQNLWVLIVQKYLLPYFPNFRNSQWYRSYSDGNQLCVIVVNILRNIILPVIPAFQINIV